MRDAFDELAERLGRDRLNAFAVERHIAKDDPGWVGPMQMIPLLDAMRDERERIETAAATLPDSMRAAAIEITTGLADQIADKAVDAIQIAVSGEIVQSVLAAKTSLETIASQHETKMTDKAGKFGVAAEAAVSKLVVAATDVRNHGAAIARLHLAHVLARAAWMLGGMVLAGAITFGILHLYNHAQCMATANRFSTHTQRLMLETEFCK